MMRLSFTISLLIAPLLLFAQQISNPAFAMLSQHPLKILKIEISEENTTIHLSIENQIVNGNFCADKNIFIQDLVSNKKYKLIKAQDIPVCPASYRFNYIGEVLNFKLVFPKIDSTVKYINLIEDCNQACFYIKGIMLDQKTNNDLSLAYNYFKDGKLELAYQTFKIALKNNPEYNFGFIHYSMIHVLIEKNDFPAAKKLYTEIINSNFEDRLELIEKLKKQRFYNRLTQ